MASMRKTVYREYNFDNYFSLENSWGVHVHLWILPHSTCSVCAAVCTCVWVLTCVCVLACVCVCVCLHLCVLPRVCACVCVCVCLRFCVRVWACVCAFVGAFGCVS